MKAAFSKLPRERRDGILDRAIEVFAERGYEGAGVSEVCERAGISNGALYKYFENKEDLFLALAARGRDLIEALYDGLDPSLGIDAYFRSLLGRIGGLPDAQRRAVALYVELGGPSLNRFAEVMAPDLEEIGRSRLRSYLGLAAARGEIGAGLDLDAAVFAVDNIVVLYGFSQVSEYHGRRIRAFAEAGGAGSGDLGGGRVEFLLRTIRTILAVPRA